ncbi:KRAB-A domain-containing protein 2-like [Frankliniella occidentalis]|uniref:KRAB-A domain-containing protein 2-like n=1 Tax=Frankliniella occidentalis TaxID=133901 RepID=A0A6J1TC58_FRAOC|nr:KRAB-A domain-containing protein 2-like [Frankliniella occidentalis]
MAEMADLAELPPNRAKFEERLLAITTKKAGNAKYLSEEKYLEVIKEVKGALEKEGKGLIKKERDRLKKYAAKTMGAEEYLVKHGDHKNYFVNNERMYDALLEVHLQVSHGGKNRMLPIIRKKYSNVSQEATFLFLSLCGIYLAKKKPKKRGIVVKPLVFEEMNQRCQVD